MREAGILTLSGGHFRMRSLLKTQARTMPSFSPFTLRSSAEGLMNWWCNIYYIISFTSKLQQEFSIFSNPKSPQFLLAEFHILRGHFSKCPSKSCFLEANFFTVISQKFPKIQFFGNFFIIFQIMLLFSAQKWFCPESYSGFQFCKFHFSSLFKSSDLIVKSD